MARWNANISQSQKKAGSKVEMSILEKTDDGLSAYLQCKEDGAKFWWDDQNGGRNAVTKDGIIHAQCPKCGGVWDGTVQHYYAIGYLQEPPARIKQMMSMVKKMMGPNGPGFPGDDDDEDMPMDGLVGFIIVDVIACDSPMDAIGKLKASTPEELLGREELEDGVSAYRCPKSFYDKFQAHKKIAKLHKSMSDKGAMSLKDLLDSFQQAVQEGNSQDDNDSDSPAEKKSNPRKSSKPASSNTASDPVIDALKTGEDPTAN